MKSLRSTLCSALILASCASAPRLDDAQLDNIRVATVEDQQRYEDALNRWRRESFAGASVRDPRRGVITFGPDDYDAWLFYAGVDGLLRTQPTSIDWPKFVVSFSTRRVLVEPGDLPTLRLYICGDENPIALAGLITRGGRIVTDRDREAIEHAIQRESRAQTYEVLIDYTNWDWRQSRNRHDPILLRAPTDDVCLSLVKIRWPIARPAIGSPLRIPKELIERTTGPLPRIVQPN